MNRLRLPSVLVVLEWIVRDNESSHDGLKHRTREEFLRMNVRGDNESSVKKWDGAPLSLTGASKLICPYLEIVAEGVCVEVIKNYDTLSGVSVPPFALTFEKDSFSRQKSSGVVGLSCTRYSIVPFSSSGVMLIRWLGEEMEGTKSSMYLPDILDTDYAGVYGSNYSHLCQLLIPSS